MEERQKQVVHKVLNAYFLQSISYGPTIYETGICAMASRVFKESTEYSDKQLFMNWLVQYKPKVMYTFEGYVADFLNPFNGMWFRTPDDRREFVLKHLKAIEKDGIKRHADHHSDANRSGCDDEVL